MERTGDDGQKRSHRGPDRPCPARAPVGQGGGVKTGRDPLEVVLHVGAHRTGTSALQRSLGRQAPRLAAAGIAFWGPKVLRGGKIAGLLAAEESAALTGRDNPGASEGSNDFLAGVPPSRRLILSDENMAGTMYRNWTHGTLYPEVSGQLRAVLRLLPAPPAAIYLTLRDFAGYWQSVFAHLQRVRRVSRFEAARLSASAGNSWLPALKAVRAACPEAPLHVARYDRTAAHRVMAALVGPEAARTLRPPLQGVNASRPGEGTLFSADETAGLDRAFEAEWAEIVGGAVSGVMIVPDWEPGAGPGAGSGNRRIGRTKATRRGTERTTQ